jgi:putative MFS transporter
MDISGPEQPSSSLPELTARLDRLTVWPYSYLVLWTVGIGYFISFFDITNIAFGLPVFSKLFHMSPAEAAYPISSSLFGYMLGAWLNANLGDYAGRKPAIATATICFSVGCLGCALSNGLWSMVAWRFVTGMGIGAEIAIISTYIGELAPAGLRGRYTGLANVFSFVGLACVPILALWLVPNYIWGWRVLFLIGAFGIFTLLAFPFMPESPRWLLSKHHEDRAEAIIHAAEIRTMARTGTALLPFVVVPLKPEPHGFATANLFRPPYLRDVALLLGIWFFFYIGEYTWLGLGPTFFVDRGFTLTRSIMFMVMSSVGLSLGAVLSAWLGDRFERKYSILVGVCVWIAGFVVIALVPQPGVLYAFVFIVTVALGFIIPLMYTLTNESFPTNARSSGVALTDGLGHLGGAVGPVMATTLYAFVGSAASGFTAVFLLVAASAAFAAVLLPFTISATRKTLGILKID